MTHSQKTVLVIGASGGIGNKVAEMLLEENYHVIGTYFEDEDQLKSSSSFEAIELNITDIDSISQLTHLTHLYAVINCSGIVGYESNDLMHNLDLWNRTLAVNLTGNYYIAQILFPIIEENGRFIMMSSTDAYFGGAITAAYAASKAGVNSLTKSLSLAFQSKKIRVNSIAPGWVETPMIQVNGDEFIKKVATVNPLKRNAIPEDIANLVSFLLSEKSDYINGQVLSVEGGYTNQDPTLMLEEDVQS